MTSKSTQFNDAEPVYQQLAWLLANRIISQEYGANTRLPNERTLSERYSVSRHTVRSALEQLESQDLIHRVPGRGTFVAPIDAKSTSWSSSADALLFLLPVPGIGERGFGHYYTAIIDGARHEARQLGLALRPERFHCPVKVPLERYELPHPKETRGVIVCGTFDDRYIDMFQSQNIPIVVVDYRATDTKIDCVTIDLAAEASEIITHLAKLGHSTLGFVSAGRRDPDSGVQEHDPDTWELLDGLRRAGLRHGIRIENEWVITAPSADQHMHRAIDGFLSLRRLPTVALCFDGTLVPSMLEAMRRASIDCPAQLSLVTRGPSSDDRITKNRMTYLRNNPELMGQWAVRLLAERIRGHRRDAVRVAITSRWIPGNTVAPPDPSV